MRTPDNFPPDPGTQSPAPGEMRRPGAGQSWALVAVMAVAAGFAMAVWSPSLEGLRKEAKALFAQAPPAPPPKPVAKQPATVPEPKQPTAKPAPGPTVSAPAPAPYDDRARPVSFYFAHWGVTETQSPIGWTSRIEIRTGSGGAVLARIWVTCPKGHCEAGEFPVSPAAHLQKKEMTAFLSLQRRDGDRQWTLLLRPAPGKPDELERWEWYGPPGSETKTQSVLGHVRRMRPDGTFH